MKILLDFFYINFFFFKMEITQYMLFTLFHVYTLWEDSRERETKRGHGLDKPSSMRNGPFKKKVCCPIAPRKTFIPRKYIHRKRFWAINSCDYCYFICVVVYYRLGYLRLEISRRCLSCWEGFSSSFLIPSNCIVYILIVPHSPQTKLPPFCQTNASQE